MAVSPREWAAAGCLLGLATWPHHLQAPTSSLGNDHGGEILREISHWVTQLPAAHTDHGHERGDLEQCEGQDVLAERSHTTAAGCSVHKKLKVSGNNT